MKRLAYYSASSPQPHQFTILVRGIPAHDGSSVGDAVENFFTEYHPSTYLSHVVVRRTRKLRDLMVRILQNLNFFHSFYADAVSYLLFEYIF